MRALPSGARVRDFAGGRALVNPTGSPVSLTVTRAATRLDGSQVQAGATMCWPPTPARS